MAELPGQSVRHLPRQTDFAQPGRSVDRGPKWAPVRERGMWEELGTHTLPQPWERGLPGYEGSLTIWHVQQRYLVGVLELRPTSVPVPGSIPTESGSPAPHPRTTPGCSPY